jgi:hypothetical protein
VSKNDISKNISILIHLAVLMIQEIVKFNIYSFIASEERSPEKSEKSNRFNTGIQGTLVFDSHFYEQDETSNMFTIAEPSTVERVFRNADFGIVGLFYLYR